MNARSSRSSMSKMLYIYGCGGHAKVVAATARLCGYQIAGFWEDTSERVGTDFFGSRIVRFEDVPLGSNIFVAFGNNKVRLEKGLQLQKKFHTPTLIHPSAQIAEGVKIGKGSYVGALANIDPDCLIGDFCIINNCANVSHDSVLYDGCHVCGGVQLAGHSTIGECAMMGIGSCMIEEHSVGADAIIGAGSAIIKDIPTKTVAVGSPAKVMKKING